MRVQSLGWEDPPEEGMATHSSIPSWRIPWTEEPDRLQFTGSQRIGHNWSDFFNVGDGQGGQACCDSWGRKESDTTERLNWTELKQLSAHVCAPPLPPPPHTPPDTHTPQEKKLKFHPSMGIHLMMINQVAYMCIPLFLHFFLTVKRGNGTHIMVWGAGQVWPVKKRRLRAHVKITEDLKCCPTGPEIISAIPRLVWSKTQNE